MSFWKGQVKKNFQPYLEFYIKKLRYIIFIFYSFVDTVFWVLIPNLIKYL